MPPKKGKKNAITCFIESVIVPEKQQQGYQFRNGIAALIPEASQRYKNLPQHEKQRFEQMAHEHKERNKRILEEQRRDNCGNLISERRDPREVMLQKRKGDRQLMREAFLAGPGLVDKMFYVVAFEYMLEVEKSATEVEYLPVEVGIVEWSMRGGIHREFHRVINPGDIPRGYAYKFKEHSEETHRYTIEHIREGESNYRGLWMQMENFVQPDNASGTVRVIHCLEHQHAKVDSCLTWLSQQAMCGPNRFQIRFLEDLSLELYAHAGKNVSESSVLNMLTTSAFDYEPNTRCSYHDEAETLHCAIRAAKTYTFAMSDALAAVYDYELTPDHLPTRSISKLPYVAIGDNQEQLVPDMRRLPAGRGFLVESDQFSSRDIRYIPGANSPAGDGGSMSTSPIPRPARAVPNSVPIRPPPPSRLPPPSFRAGETGMEDGMRNVSLSESRPQQDPVGPVPPNHTPVTGPDAASFIRPPPVRGSVLCPPRSVAPGRNPAAPLRNPTPMATAQANPPRMAAPPMRNPTPVSTAQANPPRMAAPPMRNPTPVSTAQAYGAPPSSVPVFHVAPTVDSDDDDFDASSMMSDSTGTSFYLPSYGGGGIVRPLGRGMLPYSGASAPSEVSVESSSLSYRSASRSARTDDVSAPPIGRGLPVARGQYLLSQTTGIGVGRSVTSTSDKSVPPPPGFRGSDHFM